VRVPDSRLSLPPVFGCLVQLKVRHWDKKRNTANPGKFLWTSLKDPKETFKIALFLGS
jgi:hypothetical protein